MQIVFEDDSIMVVYKEAGEPTQTAKGSAPDIVSMLKVHIAKEKKAKGDIYVGVVHRLDQPVSGLLVFAKDKVSAAELSKQVSTDLMNKVYIAVVEGLEEINTSGTLNNYIYKDAKENKAIVADESAMITKGMKKAVLSYEVLSVDEKEDTCSLKVFLKTGRFHQIRAQLSHMGHPIVGDVKYGAKKSFKRGIALSAVELDFVHPKTKKPMHFAI